MALMSGIQRWQPSMIQRAPSQFGPVGAINPVSAEGYVTPQQRFEAAAAARKAQGGAGVNAVDDTMATAGGGAGGQTPAAVDPLAPLSAGGVPAAGEASAAGGTVAAGGQGGIMSTIMKLLPMFMGG